MDDRGHAVQRCAYDGNALDPATGDHYFAVFGDRKVNRLHEGTWSKLSDLPWTPNVAVGMAWFGALAQGKGELVYVNGYGQLARFDGSVWHDIEGATDDPWGTYNTFAEYNPVHRLLWFGSGNEHETVHYVMNEKIELSRRKDAPFSLNNGKALHSVDTASGKFIVTQYDDQSWWEYDPIADSWTAISDMKNKPELNSTFHVPIPECGVILYFDHYNERRNAYLYRHSAAAAP